MKRYGLGVLLGLFATLGVHAGEPSDKDAILAIEKAWIVALEKKDKTFFEKNLSDDFTYINEGGALLKGNAAYAGMIVNLPATVNVEDTNETIRVIGSTGIATGHYTAKYKDGTSAETRYTDVYAKTADGWKAVASHETNVAK